MESNKRKRHVREAIWIRRTKNAINRDDGNYDLPHVYDVIILPGNQSIKQC